MSRTSRTTRPARGPCGLKNAPSRPSVFSFSNQSDRHLIRFFLHFSYCTIVCVSLLHGYPLVPDVSHPPALHALLQLLVMDPPHAVVACAPLAASRARAIRASLLTALVGDSAALAHTMHSLLVALGGERRHIFYCFFFRFFWGHTRMCFQ